MTTDTAPAVTVRGSVCVDNPRLGLVGCGATYQGRQQHSVARVPWSDQPDGRAHLTFSNERACDFCWRGDTMRHPATVTTKDGEPRLSLDDRGIWHCGPPGGRPTPPHWGKHASQSDETASPVPGQPTGHSDRSTGRTEDDE